MSGNTTPTSAADADVTEKRPMKKKDMDKLVEHLNEAERFLAGKGQATETKKPERKRNQDDANLDDDGPEAKKRSISKKEMDKLVEHLNEAERFLTGKNQAAETKTPELKGKQNEAKLNSDDPKAKKPKRKSAKAKSAKAAKQPRGPDGKFIKKGANTNTAPKKDVTKGKSPDGPQVGPSTGAMRTRAEARRAQSEAESQLIQSQLCRTDIPLSEASSKQSTTKIICYLPKAPPSMPSPKQSMTTVGPKSPTSPATESQEGIFWPPAAGQTESLSAEELADDETLYDNPAAYPGGPFYRTPEGMRSVHGFSEDVVTGGPFFVVQPQQAPPTPEKHVIKRIL